MKLVVGLGNPGERYAQTRHNVGYGVVERLASRHGVDLAVEKRLNARLGRGRLGAEQAWLLQPLSFMNLSGPVVARVVRERELELADLLVVTDDFNLPLGRLRLRLKGSAGGHNGMRSLIGALGTDEFPRLRIGIGDPPPGLAEEWVLRRFKPAERDVIDEALDRSTNCVEDWCAHGIDTTMNTYNV